MTNSGYRRFFLLLVLFKAIGAGFCQSEGESKFITSLTVASE